MSVLHQMQFFAQADDSHSERHVAELVFGDGAGQDDHQSVDDHSDRNCDEETEAVAVSHGADSNVNSPCTGTHDGGGEQRKQEGRADLLLVTQSLADRDPVQDADDKSEGDISDYKSVYAEIQMLNHHIDESDVDHE